ncbi:MAG: GntR family transcriptional regulator, partial [Spirochaetales bacterium]|nr:GntR family transcriptional regulator [Spirochaetales bacterium]
MKIVSQSLADQVYELVKSEILKGNIKGGEKIREDSLATQFGVSRTPIREALTRLAEYGLI